MHFWFTVEINFHFHGKGAYQKPLTYNFKGWKILVLFFFWQIINLSLVCFWAQLVDDDEGYDSPTIIYMELEYMGRGQEPNLQQGSKSNGNSK